MGKTKNEQGRTYTAFIDIHKSYPTAYRPAIEAIPGSRGHARDARKVYVAIEDAEATRAAAEHSHVKESLEIYQGIRKVHGVTTLPRKILHFAKRRNAL